MSSKLINRFRKSASCFPAMFKQSNVLIYLGAGDELVTKIAGTRKKLQSTTPLYNTCRFIRRDRAHMHRTTDICWTQHSPEKPVLLKEIIDEVKKAGIEGFTISELRLAKNTVETVNYEDHEVWSSWKFDSFALRPSVIGRYLMNGVRPSEGIYSILRKIKHELKTEGETEDVIKRIRDSILICFERPSNRKQIVKAWFGCPYIFVLKQGKEKFDLLDLGELDID